MTDAADRTRAEQAPATNKFEVPKDIRLRFESTFSGQTGVWVLANLLTGLGFLDKLEVDAEQIARHNHALDLLRLSGILKPDKSGYVSQLNMEKFVRSLMGILE